MKRQQWNGDAKNKRLRGRQEFSLSKDQKKLAPVSEQVAGLLERQVQTVTRTQTRKQAEHQEKGTMIYQESGASPRLPDDLPDQRSPHPLDEPQLEVEAAGVEDARFGMRMHHNQQPQPDNEDAVMELDDNFTEWCKQLNLTGIGDQPDMRGAEPTIRVSSQDATLNPVQREAEKGDFRFSIDGELLRRIVEDEFGEPVPQLVVLQPLRKRVFQLAHAAPMSAHLGFKRTRRKIQRH